MFNDDLPTPKKTLFTPAVFDGLSVDEIEDYIKLLEAEIARAKSDILKKSDWKTQAEALFKK